MSSPAAHMAAGVWMQPTKGQLGECHERRMHKNVKNVLITQHPQVVLALKCPNLAELF